MPPRDWSSDDIARLTSMWSSGQESGEIAKIMGRTRNAVMGKVNRLGLIRKNNPELLDALPEHRRRNKRSGFVAKAPTPVAPSAPADAQPAVIIPQTMEDLPKRAKPPAMPATMIKRAPQRQTPAFRAPPVVADKPTVPAVDIKKAIVTRVEGAGTVKAKRPLNEVESPRHVPLKLFVMEWLDETYPTETSHRDEMLVIVTGALLNDISPIALAQGAGVTIDDAKGVRDAMLKGGLWNKNAGDLTRYDGQEGWLQLILEAMLARGELSCVEGKWYLPEQAPKGKSW